MFDGEKGRQKLVTQRCVGCEHILVDIVIVRYRCARKLATSRKPAPVALDLNMAMSCPQIALKVVQTSLWIPCHRASSDSVFLPTGST